MEVDLLSSEQMTKLVAIQIWADSCQEGRTPSISLEEFAEGFVYEFHRGGYHGIEDLIKYVSE